MRSNDVSRIPQDAPLLSIKQKSGDHYKVLSITEVRAGQVMKVEEFDKAIEEMCMYFQVTASNYRKHSIARSKRKKNVPLVIFLRMIPF